MALVPVAEPWPPNEYTLCGVNFSGQIKMNASYNPRIVHSSRNCFISIFYFPENEITNVHTFQSYLRSLLLIIANTQKW
jgi:hypothetical protein